VREEKDRADHAAQYHPRDQRGPDDQESPAPTRRQWIGALRNGRHISAARGHSRMLRKADRKENSRAYDPCHQHAGAKRRELRDQSAAPNS
jgi:hypothetical protein